MRISDWSSDVCSSDLARNHELHALAVHRVAHRLHGLLGARLAVDVDDLDVALLAVDGQWQQAVLAGVRDGHLGALLDRLAGAAGRAGEGAHDADLDWPRLRPDRKSTRLNSSH